MFRFTVAALVLALAGSVATRADEPDRLPTAPASHAPPAAPVLQSPSLRQLERMGESRPGEASQAIAAAFGSHLDTAVLDVDAQLVRGLLLVADAQPAEAQAIAAGLEAAELRDPRGDAAASALMVRAEVAQRGGQTPIADRKAGEAMRRLSTHAPAARRLRFLLVAGGIKDSAGQLPEAAAYYQEALRLAEASGDAAWRAQLRTRLAYTWFQAGQIETARRLNEEAIDIAGAEGDDFALALAWNTQSILAADFGTQSDEAVAIELAIEHARRAGARQEEALFLANLADLHLKRGEYATALQLAREALPLVRARRDLNGEVVALANAGLALISMNQIEAGRQEVERAIAIDERRGSILAMSQMLEELGRYLERAGDIQGALSAFMRHRELNDSLLQRDTQQALMHLQESFDDERRTRELEMLEHDNRLASERLDRERLTQRVWLLLASIGGLIVLLAAMFVRQLRNANRRLQRGNEELQAAGERDPLTGLANRRVLQQAIADRREAGGFDGTLFMIDIDGFKRVNDECGHAAGDAVLVEVALRLRRMLRSPDLIVRWGGEEFLVLTASQGPEQAETLARRMLRSIGDKPIRTPDQPIAVSVSIGYATLPIEPHAVRLDGETALALVDAAMLLAKRHGRNRAYGVRLLQAEDQAGVEALLPEFEAASRDGRIQLSLLRGPAAVTAALRDTGRPGQRMGAVPSPRTADGTGPA